jgi:hypothetical protein
MKTRLLPLVPLSLLVAALGACGSDDDDGRGTDTGTRSGSGLAAVQLTDDLGCGYGFSVTDEDQETLLSVHRSADAGRVTRSVSLPDSGWDAEVRVGTNLAANWCSDLIMQPDAMVTETWEVVEGTLEFVGEVPPVNGSAADQPVRAQLTGVVVESAGGERVELGDLSLVNESWGFFAG